MLIPLAMALGGADYLAPRNLVGAMVPFSALVAVLATWPRAARRARARRCSSSRLLALLAVTLTVELDPKYQRSDWKGVVKDLPAGNARAMVVNELGSAPLRYYTPGLRTAPRSGDSVRVREIVLAGEEPLRASAGTPPARRLQARRKARLHGPRGAPLRRAARRDVVSARTLRHANITLVHGIVLAPGSVRTAR